MKLSNLIIITLLGAVFTAVYFQADIEVVLLAIFVIVVSIVPIALDYERREEARRELNLLRKLLEDIRRRM